MNTPMSVEKIIDRLGNSNGRDCDFCGLNRRCQCSIEEEHGKLVVRHKGWRILVWDTEDQWEKVKT